MRGDGDEPLERAGEVRAGAGRGAGARAGRGAGQQPRVLRAVHAQPERLRSRHHIASLKGINTQHFKNREVRI